MNRVAIVGSCITRDLWPRQASAPAGLLYVARTSLGSLLAPPLAAFRVGANPPPPLKRNPHDALVADLRKTALARLLAFRPTHLIFDFIDERFDLLAAGGTIVNESWELTASGYLRQAALRNARRIPRHSPAAEQLWLEGATELAGLVRATPLANARLILHSAQWATRLVDGTPLTDVQVLPGRPADIAAHNALLARYEASFRALMPPMEVMAAPEHRTADKDHLWGLSPFHYPPAYYAAIWDQLAAMGVERPA